MQNVKIKMQNYNAKIKNGFSLLELILYVAILSIVTLAGAGIFISINRGGGQAEARSEVNSALRFAVEKISQDLRSATSTALLSSPANTTEPANILTFTIGEDTVSYSINANNRIQRVFNAVPEIITSDTVKINTLIFKRLENTNTVLNKTSASINIEIGASYNSDSPDWQYNETKKTTIGLR